MHLVKCEHSNYIKNVYYYRKSEQNIKNLLSNGTKTRVDTCAKKTEVTNRFKNTSQGNENHKHNEVSPQIC